MLPNPWNFGTLNLWPSDLLTTPNDKHMIRGDFEMEVSSALRTEPYTLVYTLQDAVVSQPGASQSRTQVTEEEVIEEQVIANDEGTEHEEGARVAAAVTPTGEVTTSVDTGDWNLSVAPIGDQDSIPDFPTVFFSTLDSHILSFHIRL